MKINFPFFTFVILGLPLTSYCNAKTLAAYNSPLVTQVHEFLNINNLIPNDASIEIQSITDDVKHCTHLRFKPIPEKHSSSSLRITAECLNKQPWSQILNIKIFPKTDYFVTKRPLKRGDTIHKDDLNHLHDDLRPQISNLLRDTNDLSDKTAAHNIKTGTILRKNDLSDATLVTRNERVKIIHSSVGFSITNFGKALNNGAKNQIVKVQLDNKQFISGKAVAIGTVEVKN